MATRSATRRYTYGLRSWSILVALVNAMLLLSACGAIAWGAANSLNTSLPIDGHIVAIVAAPGIVVNSFSAWLLMANSRYDINLRATFLHMALDAAVSLEMVIGGLSSRGQRWARIDPAISLAIVLIVLFRPWGLLRDALWLVLNVVPAHINLPAVLQHLLQQRGVVADEDLHIWCISTTQTALTARLVMSDGRTKRIQFPAQKIYERTLN